MTPRALSAVIVAFGVFAGGAAWADKIDGSWCRDDGAHISIDGSSIVTQGGTTISGDYRRHFFSFVVPPAEPGAGSTVSLALLNENTVQERVGSAPPRIWVRCTPPVSLLHPGGRAAS